MRELRIAADLAEAFLKADRPIDVYRTALDRITPLIDASFSCIFLREDGSDLLMAVASHNWPLRHAELLDEMRVRVGNGPTGRAVLEDRAVEVEDVFNSEEHADWRDSARELGFTSTIALPLTFQSAPAGAVTFYFRDPESFRSADRGLLRLVAAQMATAAERGFLLETVEDLVAKLDEQTTLLEEANLGALEARRIKNEFLANISHELRTPLTAILGYTYLLREGVSGPLTSDQDSSVRKIEEAGGQLLGVIDGMLDLTGLRLDRVEPQPQLCDARDLAKASFEKVDFGDDLAASIELPDEPIPIHTDPVLVDRILEALLQNAVKFTDEGSIRLTVQSREPEPLPGGHYRRGNDVVWEVHDTGIGIDPDHYGVIFEDFRQADGSATRRYGGAGIGLAVARGIARRLGGDVTVRSRPGEGSTFVLTLPSSVVRAGRAE
jgi:signal transduction histidine kinase